MDYGSFAHHTLTFDVAQAAPRVLVEMAGGRLAVRIDPDEASGSTSLVGTMEDLHRFASAIHAALIAHETGTHPIGEAAREVAANAEVPSFADWALDQSINVNRLDDDAYATLERQYVRTFSEARS